MLFAAASGAACAALPVARLAAADSASIAEVSHATGIEWQLAQFAAGVHYIDLPDDAVQACKRFLVDALGCCFAAVGTEPAAIAGATYRKAFGTGGNATIVGQHRTIATEGAILVNGTLLRQLDLNDVYFGQDPAHPSEIIPAAIACCEEARRSGRDLLEAIAVGYEAEVRLGNAFAWGPRGMIASSAAAYVAPLVAGKAWRLPVDQVVQAMGISGPRQLNALAVNSGEISMMKSVGPGHTVMDAVFATRLAAAGLTGVARSLEWLAANTPPRTAVPGVDLDAGHFQLGKVGLKRFPLQGELQAVAEAGANLHAAVRGRADSITEIRVEAYPATLGRGVAEAEKYHPANRETADHSLPVCLAMALLDGDVTVSQFSAGRWQAAEVLALAQKVRVVAGAALMAQMPQGRGTIVEVHFGGGQVLRETVLVPEGDAVRPMSRQALVRKFRQFAEPVVGAGAAGRIIDAVDGLEKMADVRRLTEMLRPRT